MKVTIGTVTFEHAKKVDVNVDHRIATAEMDFANGERRSWSMGDGKYTIEAETHGAVILDEDVMTWIPHMACNNRLDAAECAACKVCRPDGYCIIKYMRECARLPKPAPDNVPVTLGKVPCVNTD